MRILLVNESARAHAGGVHRMVVETCDLLAQAGHAAGIACQDTEPADTRCPVFRLPRTTNVNDLSPAFQAVLERFRPDIVQLHQTQPPAFLPDLSGRVATCRFVHDQGWFCSGGDRMAADYTPCHRPHGLACLAWHYRQGCGGKTPWGNWRRWRLVQGVRHTQHDPQLRIQVASQFMRRGLLENGYAASQIDVVPLFALPPRQPSHGQPGQLLVASRLVPGKGVECLLEALATIRGLPWHLQVAGAGPLRGRLEELSRRLDLTDRVQFPGELSREDLDACYAQAAIVISPVLRLEPFGLVGPEAMAHAKPVIAFGGGATDEWLVDGRTGLAVAQRTPAALAEAIARLLRNPEQAAEFGQEGHRRWLDLYHPAKYLERLMQAFGRTIRS